MAREAARAAAEAGSSLSGDAREQLEQASLGVARELRGELQRGQSDTSRALSQIQPRLQVCLLTCHCPKLPVSNGLPSLFKLLIVYCCCVILEYHYYDYAR